MLDLKAIRFVEGTKISHDYDGNDIEIFSYRDLIERQVPSIGIPCRQNGLIVIDVDVAGTAHKKDGREWWTNFVVENSIPETYTVHTRSGGYHFYFRLPETLNPATFRCPSTLADGVDIKWNGWVGAPPSAGYTVVRGNVGTIAEAPPTLLMEIANQYNKNPRKEYGPIGDVLNLHTPFSPEQIVQLRRLLKSAQSMATLGYTEWRDGLFSLKAGLPNDIETLHEFALAWTHNRSYMEGDEARALALVDGADSQGNIGPGTIFSILKTVAIREGAPIVQSPFTRQEIFDRSQCRTIHGQDGTVSVQANESNVAALIGAMFDSTFLYHDIRQDQYMYKGKAISDTELVNTLTPMIQSEAHGLGLGKVKMSMVSGAIEILMYARQIDPHLKWLKEIQWDGTPRIDKFFQNYVGIPDSEYVTAVSKNFWISMVARGLRPGIKFDSMVVLEGHEGIRKSSLVQAIGGEYTFTPSTVDLMNNTDELRKMHQSIIVELPELMGLVKQDSNKVKAFLSKPFDHIRALYSRKAMKRERGFVFMGTTNSNKYLAHDMGARRFWPLRVPDHIKTIELYAIQADREQLFAEAVVRFNKGENFYEVPMENLQKRIKERVTYEPLLQPIKEVITLFGDDFSIYDVYQRLHLMNVIPTGLTESVSKRIESALITCGVTQCETVQGTRWKNKTDVVSLDSFL